MKQTRKPKKTRHPRIGRQKKRRMAGFHNYQKWKEVRDLTATYLTLKNEEYQEMIRQCLETHQFDEVTIMKNDETYDEKTTHWLCLEKDSITAKYDGVTYGKLYEIYYDVAEDEHFLVNDEGTFSLAFLVAEGSFVSAKPISNEK